MDRCINFSAGPANLPLEVLNKAQSELVNFQNEGMSIMEMSHRSKTFESVLELSSSDSEDVSFLKIKQPVTSENVLPVESDFRALCQRLSAQG